MILQSIARLLTKYRMIGISLFAILSWSIFSASTPHVQSSVTGEDIFKAVYFVDGAFASKIPALASVIQAKQSLTAAERLQFTDVENKVIADIARTQPAFFATFERIMKSKNKVQIENELLAGASLVESSIQKVTSVTIDQAAVARVQQFATTEKVQQDMSKNNIVDLRQKGSRLFAPNTGGNKANPACVAVAVVVAVAAVVVLLALWLHNRPRPIMFASTIVRDQITNSIANAF